MEWWIAFIFGLGGSFHCLGMCGPITLALPTSGGGRTQFVVGRLLYNGGRVFTYALLGALFGLLGELARLAGLQQILSIVAGATILLGAALPLSLTGKVSLGPIVARLKAALSRLFRTRTRPTLFLIGLLNGLLPCGFVYFGLAGAAATGDIGQGALYMAAFGAGTIPLMLLTALSGHLIGKQPRQFMRRLLPLGAVLLGGLLVLRGLGLDIPYLSPALQTNNTIAHCQESLLH